MSRKFFGSLIILVEVNKCAKTRDIAYSKAKNS